MQLSGKYGTIADLLLLIVFESKTICKLTVKVCNPSMGLYRSKLINRWRCDASRASTVQ